MYIYLSKKIKDLVEYRKVGQRGIELERMEGRHVVLEILVVVAALQNARRIVALPATEADIFASLWFRLEP